jgi:hypothetical protein
MKKVMQMANNLSSDNFASALSEELGLYAADILKEINKLSDEAVKEIVRKTKKTAPKRSGDFRKSIASKKIVKANGVEKYVWYVKAPHYRLTHLLVHGHATVNGGRTKGHPFLQNALDEVLPKYEADIEKAVQG